MNRILVNVFLLHLWLLGPGTALAFIQQKQSEPAPAERAPKAEPPGEQEGEPAPKDREPDTQEPGERREAEPAPGDESVPRRPQEAVPATGETEPEVAEAKDTQFIEGQVTDAIGAGQKDVTVTVYPKKPDGTRGEAIGQVATDKMGDFRIDLPAGATGPVVIVFTKASLADLVKEVELRADAPPPYLAETLVGSLALEGRVESAAGKTPVAKAAVELSAAYQHWSATTDEAGKFAIAGIAPGRGELTVTAEGFGREQVRIAKLADPGELVIVLKPERIVRVTVVDDRGEAVAGAVVEVLDEERGDFRSLITGEDGRVEFRGVHFDARELRTKLSHRTHVSSDGFDRRLDLPGDEAQSADTLVMNRAATVTGTVKDAESGRAIYGARVITGSRPHDETPRDWTDAEGKFEIAGVPPGEAVVTVHMDGYAPQLRVVPAQVEDGAAVEFLLSPGATIRGVVKDADGKPVASAEAVVGMWQGHETLGFRAMTDERGEFVFENVPPEEFELTVYAEKMTPEKLTVSARDSQTIEIELEAGDDPADRVLLAVGSELPALALKGLDGKPIDLKSYAGKVLVIDFWATWCGPCLTELPKLTEVYEKYKSRDDFVLIGISRDFEEADLRNFLMGRPRMAWPQVVGAGNGSDEAAEKFGVSGIPALFVIDKKGRVAVTGVSAAELAEHIDKLLKAAGPE